MDERTFADLLAALREAPAQVARQLGSVPSAAWESPVENGEGGWTRRQLLAHMAANDLRQITRIRIGSGLGDQADREALERQLDVDPWNQARVDERAGRGVQELLDEMQSRRGELVSLLESLSPAQREHTFPFRNEQLPLDRMVPAVLGHIAAHAGEIAAPSA